MERAERGAWSVGRGASERFNDLERVLKIASFVLVLVLVLVLEKGLKIEDEDEDDYANLFGVKGIVILGSSFCHLDPKELFLQFLLPPLFHGAGKGSPSSLTVLGNAPLCQQPVAPAASLADARAPPITRLAWGVSRTR